MAFYVLPSRRWCLYFLFPLFAYVFQEGPRLAVHFFSDGRFALLPKSRPPEDSSLDSFDMDFLIMGLRVLHPVQCTQMKRLSFSPPTTGRFALLPKNRPTDDSSLDSLDKDFDKCMRLYLDHADAEEELGAQRRQLFVGCRIIYVLTWTTVRLQLVHSGAEEELGAREER